MLLDGHSLTLESFKSIVQGHEKVSLCPKAKDRLTKSRAVVEKAAQQDEKVYSINTGFGVLSKVKIDKDQLEQLQVNLIRSHCAGVGEIHSETESRAILLLRTNVIVKGYSGARPELAELLIEMLMTLKARSAAVLDVGSVSAYSAAWATSGCHCLSRR